MKEKFGDILYNTARPMMEQAEKKLEEKARRSYDTYKMRMLESARKGNTQLRVLDFSYDCLGYLGEFAKEDNIMIILEKGGLDDTLIFSWSRC